MSAFLAAAYLLTGIVHGILDVDVGNRSGASLAIVTMHGKKSNSPERGLADHHCHGCFAVSVPTPAQHAELVPDSKSAEMPKSAAPLYGDVVGLDPPPPKFLI